MPVLDRVADRWIKVDESLPPPEELVLVVTSEGQVRTALREVRADDKVAWWVDDDGLPIYGLIRFWQPLPAAPPAEEKVAEVLAFEQRVHELVGQISYREDYSILVERDKRAAGGRLYLQVEHGRRDVQTGEMGLGRGGKAYLSPAMTDSEIVRKAFQLCLAYEEHEVREHFQFRGRRVFGPHIDVEALWRVAEDTDERKSEGA